MIAVPSWFYGGQPGARDYTYTSYTNSSTGTDYVVPISRGSISCTYAADEPRTEPSHDDKWEAYLAKRALSIAGQNRCLEQHNDFRYRSTYIPECTRYFRLGRSPRNSGQQYRARGLK